jgi:DNA-binding HxlR family transcriptional regulator
LRCRKCEPVPEDFRRAASLLERRWLLSILYAAQEGALRFNEFRYALAQIPPRTLAARLAELEEEGILERRVYNARPPRVEYVLTERGWRLGEVIDALRRVAKEGVTT